MISTVSLASCCQHESVSRGTIGCEVKQHDEHIHVHVTGCNVAIHVLKCIGLIHVEVDAYVV